MTTIIGLKAYDTNYEKEYIILGSDTQISLEDKKEKTIYEKLYNSRKIRTGKKNLFCYGYSGIPFIKEELDKKTRKAIFNLNWRSKNQEEIKKNIRKAGKKIKNSYIIASRFEDDLSLDDYIYTYRTIFNREMFPRLELTSNLVFSFKGTGAEYAKKIIFEKLVDKKIKKNNQVVLGIPLQEAILIGFAGIKNASYYDEKTGGNFSFGIITNKKIHTEYNFLNLNSTIEEAKDKLKNKNEEIKENSFYQRRKIDSLEDLVFD